MAREGGGPSVTDGWELSARSPNHPLTHMWACEKKNKKKNLACTHTPIERENAHTSAGCQHTQRESLLLIFPRSQLRNRHRELRTSGHTTGTVALKKQRANECVRQDSSLAVGTDAQTTLQFKECHQKIPGCQFCDFFFILGRVGSGLGVEDGRALQ